MSGCGSSVPDEVKVSSSERVGKSSSRRTGRNKAVAAAGKAKTAAAVVTTPTEAIGDDDDDDLLEIVPKEIKIEEGEVVDADHETLQHNGKEEEELPPPPRSESPLPPPPDVVADADDDEVTQDAEELGFDKDSDGEEEGLGVAEKEGEGEEESSASSCFKIDKVYSVAKEEGEKHKSKESKKSSEGKVEGKASKLSEELKKNVSVNSNSTDSSRGDKPLKPKTTLATLAKVPTITGGVGGVRLLSGGVRGSNVPLLLSMGAGNPGIPLLPAGLPPGRYVILPGTSTTTKTTCATVNTTSVSMTPRLATSVVPPMVAASAVVGQVATSSSASSLSSSLASATLSVATPSAVVSPPTTATAVAVAGAVTARSITSPTIQLPSRPHARERGRRKSYTTGEKLAMIEAVEAGQRKSTVADRFGVAPSTLACILAQKNKIRAEQDNLTRRRFRHVKYMEQDGRGSVGTSGRVPTSATPTLHTIPASQEQPFTHFLASLTGPAPTVIDAQPEEIIAVPDLMERMDGISNENSGTGTGPGISSSSESKLEDGVDDEDGESGVECLGVVEAGGGNSAMDVEYAHETPTHEKSSSFTRTQQNDAIEESVPQEITDRPSSPNSQGLTGPYLLKKETHCATVLDQLLRDDTYTDVTLTAEGQSLRAHRIVLCLASPYFRQVLSREQNVQSVVLLRDVKFAELRNIINFIYTGEATVDATDLESFMRTAEMLEITSLSEGQKYISSRGLSQGGGGGGGGGGTASAASGFSIGDFERLVGAKRSGKDPGSPPRKSRRISGEDEPSSRASSAEPTPTIPLALLKEEPNIDPSSTSQDKPEDDQTIPSHHLTAVESTSGENTSIKSDGETTEGKRKRRDSSGSIGGFASIAGVPKASSEADEEEEVFTNATPKAETSTSSSMSESHTKSSIANSEENMMSSPGRCPYCPHVDQKFEGVDMMRHLLVSHPCKPAFPCSFCWRVFVKRSNFKSHLQNCQQSY